jgi:hypothetical protein
MNFERGDFAECKIRDLTQVLDRGRTQEISGATSPSVDVQSVPRFNATPLHANARETVTRKRNLAHERLDYVGSPCEGLGLAARNGQAGFTSGTLRFPGRRFLPRSCDHRRLKPCMTALRQSL